MADPVATPYEILRRKKRATCRQKCGEINPHCQCDCEAEGDLAALEAAGWEIKKPADNARAKDLLRDCWQALGMMGERFPHGSMARVESESLIGRIKKELGE